MNEKSKQQQQIETKITYSQAIITAKQASNE